MANLMIFCGICRKFDKFHGKQQNAMANLETGGVVTAHGKATKSCVFLVLFTKYVKDTVKSMKSIRFH